MIPKPAPSLVINYYYLWQHEAKEGQESGTKNRPCVIVSAEPTGEHTNVMVVPVTHTKPNENMAVKIPPKVADHLGLDHEDSYIVCTEMNSFVWPGYDLTPLQDDEKKFVYGWLPPRLFEDVKQKIAAFRTARKLRVVSRN